MPKRVKACPISKTKVYEQVARLNGLVSLLFVVGGIYYPVLWIIIAVDFLIRSINPRASLVSKMNRAIIAALKIKPTLIDEAPKKFAARMGFVMSSLLILLSHYDLMRAVAFVLVFFITAMLLEVLFKYCVGCKIYSILVNLKLIK